MRRRISFPDDEKKAWDFCDAKGGLYNVISFSIGCCSVYSIACLSHNLCISVVPPATISAPLESPQYHPCTRKAVMDLKTRVSAKFYWAVSVQDLLRKAAVAAGSGCDRAYFENHPMTSNLLSSYSPATSSITRHCRVSQGRPSAYTSRTM
jgi:hypothetical protein